MSSDPRWRFRSLRPIAAETQRRLRATRSYGEARLQPLPIRRTGGDLRIGDDIFRQADERVSLPGSTLRLLQPAGPARASAGATRSEERRVGKGCGSTVRVRLLALR